VPKTARLGESSLEATLDRRTAAKRPGLNVLNMTGYWRNAVVHNGRLDQGVNTIEKPFTQAALAAKIRNPLDGLQTEARLLANIHFDGLSSRWTRYHLDLRVGAH
jgi:nitrogen-specific signal transduction histidine kinase